jgi:hypothetical protein
MEDHLALLIVEEDDGLPSTSVSPSFETTTTIGCLVIRKAGRNRQ